MTKGRTRRHVFDLVDDQAGQPALAFPKRRQLTEQLLVGKTPAPILDDPLSGVEKIRIDDGFEGPVLAHPHVRRVDHTFGLQFEGPPIIDVVTDILLIGQNLVDRGACPRSTKIRRDAFGVQQGGDLAFGPSLQHEEPVKAANDLNLRWRPWCQNYAIRLQALLFAARQLAFGPTALIHQLSA
ncbi:hypothetical protein D3C80_1233450 [compost metagenome]